MKEPHWIFQQPVQPCGLNNRKQSRVEIVHMEIADRIAQVRGKSSRASFAARLKIQENTLRNYEKALSLPNANVIARICTECNLNPTWLLFGRGPMRLEAEVNAADEAERAAAPGIGGCLRCHHLEARIDAMEEERRDLYSETRQLLRENGELKARLAYMEGRSGSQGMPVLPDSGLPSV